MRSFVAWTASLGVACSSPRGESIGNHSITSAPAQPPTIDPLPLAKGDAFIYDVTIVFYDQATGQDATAQFPWTMTVVDVHDGHIKISGFPTQLVDFDAKLPYHPPAPKILELVRTDSGMSLGTEQWFTFPLVDGQRTCPDPQAMRYCWEVRADHERLNLVFVTNPDENNFEITPGVGITRYAYSHHGTTMQVTAKLVSHPGH